MEIKEYQRLIGKTPLYKISYTFKGNAGFIYVKDEGKNASGSIKDRPALRMLLRAYEEGRLKKGQVMAEATSGNMGIALASLGQVLGNPVHIYMPKSMSLERRIILKEKGALIYLVDEFADAFKDLKVEEANGSFIPHQFDNLDNPHSYEALVEEVLSKGIHPTSFISGVGTGGTLMGVLRGFKKIDPGFKGYCLRPIEALKAPQGVVNHLIEGISDGFTPSIFKENEITGYLDVHDYLALGMAQKIKRELGVGVGVSSGANLLGSILLKEPKTLTVFPDQDDRYKGSDLFTRKIEDPFLDSITLNKLEVL